MIWYFLGGLCAGLLLWLVWLNFNPKITTLPLPFASLPEEFDGFTVALLSDLHDSTFGKNNRRLLRAVKAAAPDIVCLGGDMHQDRDGREYLAFLSGLCGAFPVFSCDGNHDVTPEFLGEKNEAYRKALRETGIHPLTGNSYSVRRGKASVRICGIGFRQFDPALVDLGDGFSIAVLHDPLFFDRLPEKPSLTLSGHVHGGAVKLPFVGGVFAPGLGVSLLDRLRGKCFFPKYTEGLYGEPEHRLAVTVGLGKASIQPFRLIRPEILLLRLEKKD